uniref:Cystatin C (amyloid angiopathy and cerebral hemorrhage) n=1 Tax=Esox lucius TaxID=8010 RepID=A0AAY5JVL9_ESOLU
AARCDHQRQPTLYLGFEVGVLVEDGDLVLPVKLVPPVVNHLLQVSGIEAILEACILQRLSVPGPVNKVVKVLPDKCDNGGVVAGIKYIFTVNMGRTPCKKSGAETNCSVHEDPGMAATYRCTFEVWSRPWMSDIQLLKNDCPQ